MDTVFTSHLCPCEIYFHYLTGCCMGPCISKQTDEYKRIERKKHHREHKNMSEDNCTGASSSMLSGKGEDGNETRDHAVLSQPMRSVPEDSNSLNNSPQPKSEANWYAEHVRMPYSDKRLLREGNYGGWKKAWEFITSELNKFKDVQWVQNSQECLKADTCTSKFREAIYSYSDTKCDEDFHIFYLFCDSMSDSELAILFGHTIPGMVDMAIKLPTVCCQPIPLLKKDKDRKVCLTREQIACLLANAFFCTFPRRNPSSRHSEFSFFPSINFNRLFSSDERREATKVEKLKCIIHYFGRVLEKMPEGSVTFHRQCLGSDELVHWYESTNLLTDLLVSSDGSIEEDGKNKLQVDFANKYVGGGVLSAGCVQEEIRFLICPEMIISRLITEELGPTECLIMTGCEQFSSYRGYSDSFQWAGDYNRRECGGMCTEVVAIDALTFNRNPMEQFSPDKLKRELNKAYCGFLSRAPSGERRSGVATGNWGCGAFGGDHRLKALIQLMAASVAKRDVYYFTFGDKALTEDLFRIHATLKSNGKTVGEILKYIGRYYGQYKKKKKVPTATLR